jgi:ABC-2 type transport system permease protein
MKTLMKLTVLELKLFIREPVSMVFTFALPVIFLLVMGGVFGSVAVEENEIMFRGVAPMDYYTPAYIALVLTSLGVLTLPVHLTTYRERGVLKRMHASGIHAGMVLFSQGVSSLVVALIGAGILWGAAVLIYDISEPHDLLLVAAAFVLGTLCFTSIGVALGATLPSTRTAQGLGLMLFFIMLILGGAGPPPELLTGTMRTIGDLTPTNHVIALLQNPWLGFGWSMKETAIVGGITVVVGFIALKFFHWE